MRKVVHYEVVTIQPNESDTEGDSYILCTPMGDVMRFSQYQDLVTCKNCLRKIAAIAAARQSKDGHKESP